MKTRTQAEEILEHYGVKGMRWGVRKKRKSSRDAKTVSALRKKSVRELSDNDLRKINNRLNLEKQFRLLDPSTVARGKKFVGGIVVSALKTSLTAAAGAAITLYGAKAINYALKAR